MSPIERRLWPIWARIGLWGVPDRRIAWGFLWVCLAIGVACLAYSYGDRRFLGGGAMILAALWYYASIRWVDQHGRWS